MPLHLLPPGTLPDARLLLAARGLRAFGDGYVSLLLPFYLTLLGLTAFEVGLIVAATLLGAGLMTLAVGFIAHRHGERRLLLAGALLMGVTGLAVVVARDFWPLFLIALAGILNPTAGDGTLFAPLEHTLLSRLAPDRVRTTLFARYSVIGSLVVAFGAQAAALPDLLAASYDVDIKSAVQAMFVLYALIGMANFVIYRRLARAALPAVHRPAAPLEASKPKVYRLAALFSLDAFGGGFVAQSLLALWLLQRFDLTLGEASTIFFWMGILTALSQLASPLVAARFGLVNTMVYTHIPSNIMLALVPFMPTASLAIALLCVRSLFSSMDVPARSSYVMAVVSPAERPAAASLTTVPRSLAGALSPALSGYLLGLSAFGWPLVIAGGLKLVYDVALLRMFSKVQPPEEVSR